MYGHTYELQATVAEPAPCVLGCVSCSWCAVAGFTIPLKQTDGGLPMTCEHIEISLSCSPLCAAALYGSYCSALELSVTSSSGHRSLLQVLGGHVTFRAQA